MEIVEIFLFIVAALAIVAILASTIKKISSYYKQRFDYSIWSGVFILILSFSLIGIDLTLYYGENIPLFIVAGLLILITFVQDLRLSGLTFGFAGILFQLLMAVIFVFILAGLFLGLLIKVITKRSSKALNTLLGTTTDFWDGVLALPAFFSMR